MSAEIGSLIRRCGVATVYADWQMVTAKSVKRSVKKFREEGIQSFYLPRGESRRQIIEKLGIKYDTLRKAINQGRLRESSQPPSQPHVA